MGENFKYVVKAKEHKVKKGDSLQTLADLAGITWKELAQFNWGTDNPKEIKKFMKNRVGCRKKSEDGRSYVFDDKDDPGIMFIPEKPEKKSYSLNQSQTITVTRPKIFASLELQTSDISGHKLGNINILLKSEDGWPDIQLTTDKKGFFKKDKVPSGSYRVLVNGKTPGYFLDNISTRNTNQFQVPSEFGRFMEAVIHTDYRTGAISRIIVLTGSEAEKKLIAQSNLHTKTYGTPSYTEPATTNDSDETVKSPEYLIYCSDNLAISAGWDDEYKNINVKKLITDVLPSWLKDYFPECDSRGFHVIIIDHNARTLTYYDAGGHVDESFRFKEELIFHAPVGAYAVFETIDNSLFVDMTEQNQPIHFEGFESGINMDQVIKESDRQRLISVSNKYSNKVEIIYYLCSQGQLFTIACLGGTGKLENYGIDKTDQQTVHERNRNTVKHITKCYNQVIQLYGQQIEKTKNEQEIRKIGRPPKYYQMPKPPGISDDQWKDLLSVMRTNELDAWKAITNMLDDFAGRRSQGCPFFKFSLKFAKDTDSLGSEGLREANKNSVIKAVVGAEVEWSFSASARDGGVQVLTETSAKRTAKINLFDNESKAKGNVTMFIPSVEVSNSQDMIHPEKESEWAIKVKELAYSVEINSEGNTKIGIDMAPGVTVFSQGSKSTGSFSSGVEIEGKFLADALKEKYPEWEDDPKLKYIITHLQSFKIAAEVGYQGVREETILIFVSNAPGFFERRAVDDLYEPGLLWNNLEFHEQSCLTTLGWNQELYDNKYVKSYEKKLPESLETPPYKLAAAEKIAIVHLGFEVYKEYGEKFKAKRREIEVAEEAKKLM
jgi:hypothetical protein